MTNEIGTRGQQAKFYLLGLLPAAVERRSHVRPDRLVPIVAEDGHDLVLIAAGGEVQGFSDVRATNGLAGRRGLTGRPLAGPIKAELRGPERRDSYFRVRRSI
jgi:hypothetical protein